MICFFIVCIINILLFFYYKKYFNNHYKKQCSQKTLQTSKIKPLEEWTHTQITD